MNSFENQTEPLSNNPKNVSEGRERYTGEVEIWANEFATGLGPNFSAVVSLFKAEERFEEDSVRVEIFSTEKTERISVSLFPFGTPEEPEDLTARKANVMFYLKDNFEAALKAV